MTKQDIITKIQAQGLSVVNDSRVNNCGDRLELSNRAIVNKFNLSKIVYIMI